MKRYTFVRSATDKFVASTLKTRETTSIDVNTVDWCVRVKLMKKRRP
jgi:hypothetical protein